MSLTEDQMFDCLASYQVQYQLRQRGELKTGMFKNVHYDSVKEVLMGLSYIAGLKYDSSSAEVYNDKTNRIDYGVYPSGKKFIIYRDTGKYDLAQIGNLFRNKDDLIEKIIDNIRYANQLDESIDYFGHNGIQLLQLISTKSNCLFKGMSHRTIPRALLDENGVIKKGSVMVIPFYNSTTTNIGMAVTYAYYKPNEEVFSHPYNFSNTIIKTTAIGAFSRLGTARVTRPIGGGLGDDRQRFASVVRQSTQQPELSRPRTACVMRRDDTKISSRVTINKDLFHDNKNLTGIIHKEEEVSHDKLQAYFNSPGTEIKTPKKLTDSFDIDDSYYENSQSLINEKYYEKYISCGGNKKYIKRKKRGGAFTLYKDSGHFFIINDIDPTLKAYDYFNHLIYGPDKYKNRHEDQFNFVAEQEILFNRLTQFSNITFIGTISAISSMCDDYSSLNDGELLLCYNGCIYNKYGKIACTINLLEKCGLTDIKVFYAASGGPTGGPTGATPITSNDVIGLKVYTCRLENVKSNDIEANQEELIPIDKHPLHIRIQLSGEFLILDDSDIKKEEKDYILYTFIETLEQYSDVFKFFIKILKFYDYITKTLVSACHVIINKTIDITNTCKIGLDNIFSDLLKQVLKPNSVGGGSKISKKTLIQNIAKITPYIKGLSKMKKEGLTNIYNQLAPLNKYKKEDLMKKYKIKDKNLKKNEIIYMIFNSSNNR